jgi:hypothetical protein
MRPIPEAMAGMVGRKFGRFTVVGLAADYNPKKGARWAVKCACGDYETRKAAAINNPSNVVDCCRKCDHLWMVRKNYNRLGPRPIEDFINDSKQDE